MANYRSQTINYKPRMSEFEAFDKLGPRVRKALQEAVTSWDAYWCLRMSLKHGGDYVIAALERGDKDLCRKGFVPAKGFRKAVPSSYVECKVKPLKANW